MASLDVESLFTNVPVEETIKIILKNVYENSNIPSPKINREVLRKLLLICTTECPFKTPTGEMFKQIDGVSMGSCLGPTFANFYMCNLENKVISALLKKPNIYARYVDNIFIEVENEDQLRILKDVMEQNSILKFTYELNINNKLPFLDIIIDNDSTTYTTSVYRKTTNSGACMNGSGDTTDKYKKSVIGSYVRRALKTCSTWNLVHEEINKVKQMLINNNYTNFLVDNEVNRIVT